MVIAKKVVCVGFRDIGKSTMLQSLARNTPTHVYQNTVGVDLVSIISGQHKLQVWDASGSKSYDGIVVQYLNCADVVILCYTDSSIVSMEEAQGYWRKKFLSKPHIVINISRNNLPVMTALQSEPTCLGGITYTENNIALAKAQLFALMFPDAAPTKQPPQLCCTIV